MKKGLFVTSILIFLGLSTFVTTSASASTVSQQDVRTESDVTHIRIKRDQMTDGVQYGKGSHLSKGGAKCGGAIAGALLGIPGGSLSWVAGALGVASGCS